MIMSCLPCLPSNRDRRASPAAAESQFFRPPRASASLHARGRSGFQLTANPSSSRYGTNWFKRYREPAASGVALASINTRATGLPFPASFPAPPAAVWPGAQAPDAGSLTGTRTPLQHVLHLVARKNETERVFVQLAQPARRREEGAEPPFERPADRELARRLEAQAHRRQFHFGLAPVVRDAPPMDPVDRQVREGIQAE